MTAPELTLGFMSPEDELTLNPTPDFLRDWILGRAMQSFPDRQGCASLQYYVPAAAGYPQPADNEPSLLFIAVPPHGLFVGYTEDNGVTQWAPYDGSGTEPAVDYFPDGRLLEKLPVACFVSPEMAVRIVQDFCQDRQRSSQVAWVEMHQLGLAWG